MSQVIVGSSPLTRGKLNATGPALTGTGLIPAHAGKTGLMVGCTQRMGAHPRSRGENPLADERARVLGGSSPLTRGKLHAAPQADDIPGLIPAHAGKTRPGPYRLE